MLNFNHTGFIQALFPFSGAERPLTQLLKTAFTVTFKSRLRLVHEGRECVVFLNKWNKGSAIFSLTYFLH